MKEFLGIGGYKRTAEGFLSWQHILFVSIFAVAMIALAVVLGKRNKNKTLKEKCRVLLYTAFVLDGIEICKIVFLCFRENNPLHWVNCLPLFLCSIQMITIPIAAVSKGRIKEACLDFIAVFGLIGGLLGTYCAGNNFNSYPVLSLENVVSAITHSTIGFASLYILIAKMATMKKKNLPISFAILLSFCVAAYIANVLFSCNYMFLMRGDGTPYDIVYKLVNGNPVLYPLTVVLLFVVYILLFTFTYTAIQKKSKALSKV